ncbi:MAG: bifunctional folylpolyglutamate synthase/dihydrofolate synthase, partial [Muribaculaceae bacterium]|nr:bifunctional folylpolyglutamate synthase/dihydrofolate synthase [Muribaculaceae bacterium]
MTYESTIEYLTGRLASFSKLGKEAYKPGLERTVALSDAFGSPHSRLKVIHVGGTNGKGTVACSLAAVLQSAGYRVGLFTSPHLVDFRERIRVDGEMIPKEKVVDFVERFLAMKMDIEPSFFEFTTVMAFEYFDEMQVDVTVVEVGLGGRLDSTNIVKRPELCVITNISTDHTDLLGTTRKEIAREKAGIIKWGVPVVVGESDREIREVFESKAFVEHA